MRAFYGLQRPFDFKVAIPFLLNALALIIVFLLCVIFFFIHRLNIGTERFYFFSYIAALLVIGALLSRVRILSYALLCWCVVELSLAFGNSALYPKNIVTEPNPDEFAFVYHPLLQIVPRPNFQYTNTLDFRPIAAPAKAAGVDVDALQGKQLTFTHNSLGIRGKELTPADLSKELIFVYGGSTTYDVGVGQGDTWVERLQSALNNKYTVVNMGVVAHSTEEHLIETAFYQNVLGKKPICAIYYIGWNDIINAHIPNLDGAYAKYHVLMTPIRKPDLAAAKYSPLLHLVNDMGKDRFDTIPTHPNILGKTPPMVGSDQRLEAIYISNIKSIAAINASRGVKTIFIGQILNKHWPQGPNMWAPLIKRGYFPPLQDRFNAILRDTSASISAKYIDPGVANFKDGDFVDLGHFTIRGAKKFAALISNQVDSYCEMTLAADPGH
jgi:hypothetical protein